MKYLLFIAGVLFLQGTSATQSHGRLVNQVNPLIDQLKEIIDENIQAGYQAMLGATIDLNSRTTNTLQTEITRMDERMRYHISLIQTWVDAADLREIEATECTNGITTLMMDVLQKFSIKISSCANDNLVVANEIATRFMDEIGETWDVVSNLKNDVYHCESDVDCLQLVLDEVYRQADEIPILIEQKTNIAKYEMGVVESNLNNCVYGSISWTNYELDTASDDVVYCIQTKLV